jgi:AcrR family transcriptional regulator
VSELRRRRPRLDREARQRQLIDAYKSLIASNGYSNTSLRDVASAARISTGTLLHHFQAKEDLLVATLLSLSDDFLAHMEEAVAGSTGPEEKLRALIRGLFESPRHDIGWRVWIAFWHEAGVNSELASIAGERTALSESIIAGVIEEGARSGRMRCDDPAAAAAELAALVDGVAIRLYGEPGLWSRSRAFEVLDRAIAGLVVAA